MRQIGSLANESQAQLLADYLLTQGVTAHSESEGQHWSVWVREENQVERAKHVLSEFLGDPQAMKYQDAVAEANALRAEEIRRRAKIARNTVDMRRKWARPISRRAPLMMVLIGLSLFVGLLTQFGYAPNELFYALLMLDPRVQPAGDAFAQIWQGQIWRLVTPIFLHRGVIHLLFNMSWIYYLGAQIEIRRGTVRFGGLVLFLAVASNLLQAFAVGPNFLGMSGVVYGLFGYIWVKLLAGISSEYFLSDFTVFIMLFFLVLGFVGALDSMVGGVANYAHLGGLAAGMAVGYLPALRN